MDQVELDSVTEVEQEELLDKSEESAEAMDETLEETTAVDETSFEETGEELADDISEIVDESVDEEAFIPPPADKNHKVVEQLDDVTRDSEIKASQIVANLDGIDQLAIKIKDDIGFQKVVIEKNIEIFEKLSQKFSDVELFKEMSESNQELISKIDDIESELDEIATSVTNSVDIMQYQDIHRQKIERVINVMRALSRYMNSLFDSDIKDEDRVSSAKTLEGEESIADDELEALLEQFAKK